MMDFDGGSFLYLYFSFLSFIKRVHTDTRHKPQSKSKKAKKQKQILLQGTFIMDNNGRYGIGTWEDWAGSGRRLKQLPQLT